MNININGNTKINFSSETFRILYNRYKEFLLPISVIIVSVFLFIFFTIPSIQNFFATQDQAKTEQQNLLILKNNLNVLSNIDSNTLNNQLVILTSTLPTGKDFAGVINAINSASVPSGVAVGNFDFQVGDLTNASKGIGSFPNLQITVNLSGDFHSMVNYIKELAKTAPLSDVTSIKINSTSATITVVFYFKPFLQAQFSDRNPISDLSQKEVSLISTLESWNNVGSNSLPASTGELSGVSSATDSSGLKQSPF